MPTQFRGIPGVYAGRSITPRNIWVQDSAKTVVPQLITINGTLSRDIGNNPISLLRAGMLLGKVTTGGKYRNSIIGISNKAYADNDLSIQTDLATATEVARLKAAGGGGNLDLKFIGPPSAAGVVAVTDITVTAVTLNGATSTLTVADLNLNKVTKSILAPADGAHIPLTILDEEFGVDVTDLDGASIDQPLPQYVTGGDLISSQILYYSDLDASTKEWLKNQLRTYGNYTFDDDRK